MKYPNWVLLVLAVGAILLGLLVQSGTVTGMEHFGYQDNTLAGVIKTSSAIGVGTFVLSALILMRTRQALLFTDEVVSELMQVTWPTRDETVRASTTVVLTTFFTAAVIAIYDYFWKNLADLFLFTEG